MMQLNQYCRIQSWCVSYGQYCTCCGMFSSSRYSDATLPITYGRGHTAVPLTGWGEEKNSPFPLRLTVMQGRLAPIHGRARASAIHGGLRAIHRSTPMGGGHAAMSLCTPAWWNDMFTHGSESSTIIYGWLFFSSEMQGSVGPTLLWDAGDPQIWSDMWSAVPRELSTLWHLWPPRCTLRDMNRSQTGISNTHLKNTGNTNT